MVFLYLSIDFAIYFNFALHFSKVYFLGLSFSLFSLSFSFQFYSTRLNNTYLNMAFFCSLLTDFLFHLYSSYMHICFCYATPNEDQIHYLRLSLCTVFFKTQLNMTFCKKYLYYSSRSVSGQPFTQVQQIGYSLLSSASLNYD